MWICISNTCNTEFRYYNKSRKWCNDLILIDFVSKTFASIIENTLFYICTVIPECLNRIHGETWEELTAQVINLCHFCVLVHSQESLNQHGSGQCPVIIGCLCWFTKPRVLTWATYYHLFTQKFNLDRLKQTHTISFALWIELKSAIWRP